MSSSMDEMLILPNAKRARISEDEDEDRLSELPDCILLHILSSVNAKDAVRTCVLSKRWKNLWKHLPVLILHSPDFSSLPSFNKFVSKLLTRRDRSTALPGLDFERAGRIQPHLLKRIVSYAVSHNVQRLGLSVTCAIKHFPECLFLSQTLTSLKLSVYSSTRGDKRTTLFPKSLYNLLALTTLHLGNFVFCANDDGIAEPFSGFNQLSSLTIEFCSLSGAQTIYISSKTLANLTVLHQCLTYKMHLSSPNLRTFAFTGASMETLCGRYISSIEHVNFDIHVEFKCAFMLLSWLVDLANIKSLTVSLRTLQVLSSIPLLLEFKYPILTSLKSLKVIVREDKVQKVPDGIVEYLLQNSPSAKVDIIRCSR